MSDTDYKKLGRILEDSRKQFYLDFKATIDKLYNVPSVFAWTIFNEGWGQFDSALISEEVHSLDPTRLMDSTSGWYDKKVGDFKSEHIYFWTFLNLKNDHKRILSLSEFGGYSLKVEHHVYSARSFGYRYYNSFNGFNDAVTRLYRKRIVNNIKRQGLGVAVYTQLSDIEEEQNGLVTYDRKIVKINVATIKALNLLCAETFYKKINGETK